MAGETMTGKERWLAVLDGEKPDRVPMDIWATDEAWDKLCAHLECGRDEALARLHIDTPHGVGPVHTGPIPAPDADLWGLTYRTVEYGTGTYTEVTNAPLAHFGSVEEIEANYRWPSPDDWDYSTLPAQVRGKEDRVVRGGGSEPFLVYKHLRGETQAFVDLLMNPDIVHYCMDKMYGLAYEQTRRIFEAIPGVVDVTYVAEDLGGQENLMYAPDHIREYFLPHMKRMADLTRENGSHVFFHTDGAVREIIHDLLGIGIQVLNPIQWRCPGMDREGLKRDFGVRLKFHGGVDNQQTLPFGSVDDVRREVIENLEILGTGGGYILAPCHNIQAVSPADNVVALYEAGYDAGKM